MEKGHKGLMITSKIVAKEHKKSRKSQKSKLSKKNVIMKEIKRGKVTKTGRFRLKKLISLQICTKYGQVTYTRKKHPWSGPCHLVKNVFTVMIIMIF